MIDHVLVLVGTVCAATSLSLAAVLAAMVAGLVF
jgi:hypothetical protein